MIFWRLQVSNHSDGPIQLVDDGSILAAILDEGLPCRQPPNDGLAEVQRPRLTVQYLVQT